MVTTFGVCLPNSNYKNSYHSISVELRPLSAVLKDESAILLILRLAVDDSLEVGL